MSAAGVTRSLRSAVVALAIAALIPVCIAACGSTSGGGTGSAPSALVECEGSLKPIIAANSDEGFSADAWLGLFTTSRAAGGDIGGTAALLTHDGGLDRCQLIFEVSNGNAFTLDWTAGNTTIGATAGQPPGPDRSTGALFDPYDRALPKPNVVIGRGGTLTPVAGGH